MRRSCAKFISSAEIRQRLGVCPATVTKMLRAGKIPAVDIGVGGKRKHYRILRSDFEKFIEEARSGKLDEE